jgi:hypothetical protein
MVCRTGFYGCIAELQMEERGRRHVKLEGAGETEPLITWWLLSGEPPILPPPPQQQKRQVDAVQTAAILSER